MQMLGQIHSKYQSSLTQVTQAQIWSKIGHKNDNDLYSINKHNAMGTCRNKFKWESNWVCK